MSGRSRQLLDEWFSDTGVGLSAEHGCFYKHPANLIDQIRTPERESSPSPPSSDTDPTEGTNPSQQPEFFRRKTNDGWIALVDHVDSAWRETIRPLFQHYTERTPGSFIEEKEINLTWRYESADPEFGAWQAAELQVNLEKILSHMAVSIILGNKTLELRPSTVDKATAARSILKDLNSPEESDFLLCVGDGKTDEPVFTFLGEVEGSWTATVGKKQTEAQYYLEGVADVEGLVGGLAEC
ncbi:Trehalose-6-P synthase/phosphatase complex synthase subunit [Rhizophlyctis rosea]|uniref:Trehalose 6-phosphate phosphatase n=1 Tax=Rhizophlyctis rosea TaxID=64517 RepID=A0AAD5S1J2_9FUNG|nr:Trehalose-6-P synthase/phosphatase complex synthase subunit [Rhizophlyctis rosea]